MFLDHTEIKSKKELKQEFRQQIYEAFGNECAYCGDTPQSLDHVKPKYDGGQTVASNLVPSCHKCNQAKGSKHWLDWFKSTRNYTEYRATKIIDWTGHNEKNCNH